MYLCMYVCMYVSMHLLRKFMYVFTVFVDLCVSLYCVDVLSDIK